MNIPKMSLSDAIASTYKKLRDMPEEEFKAALENHEGSDLLPFVQAHVESIKGSEGVVSEFNASIQEAKDAVKDSNLDLKWLETQSGAFATISTQKLVRILKAIRDLK